MAWEFRVAHPRLLHDTVRLSLPRDFPATPAQIHLHKDLCLSLPHVEVTGKESAWAWKLLLTTMPNQCKLDNRACLRAFEHFLTKCNDEDWIVSEFRRECWSYWVRFCDKAASRREARPTPSQLYVAIQGVETITEGSLAVPTTLALTVRRSKP